MKIIIEIAIKIFFKSTIIFRLSSENVKTPLHKGFKMRDKFLMPGLISRLED